MWRSVQLGLAVVSLAGVALAQGQANLASITGIITDPSGAVVPKAEIVASNGDTGIVSRTQANEAGVYVAFSLIPGPYSVEVRASGFKVKRIQGVVLDTGQKMRLDVALEVGAITEQVEVQATATPLMQETAEISKTITAKEIESLPLAGRDPLQLLGLASGVTVRGGDPTSLQYYGEISVNGSEPRKNAFVADGASLGHIGGLAESVGSIEAVGEFKLLSSTYSAEYGRTSGGVITFQIKSGTQNLHGSFCEYHRDNALTANDWESNANGVTQDSLIHNEFGGTLGGPVPGMKKKLFFFVSYEGVRERVPANRSRTIPDPAIRGGNFSGLPAIINDPLSGAPFANNIIPVTRLDSAAVKFLQLFPTPNTQGTFNPRFGIRNNNWIRAAQHNEPHDYTVFRLDHNPRDKDKFFFTFSFIKEGPFDYGPDFENALNTTRGLVSRQLKRGAFGYTRFLRPNLTNEFIASAQRDPRRLSPRYPFDVSQGLGQKSKISDYLPSISISGFGGFGDSRFDNWVNQPSVLSDSITYLRGHHTMKAGVQLYQNQYWYRAAFNTAGSYSFNGEISGLGSAGRDNPLNGVADLLLGAVKGASINIRQIPVNRLNYNLGMFFNDDWKVSNRLTLNLGLRYEFETKQTVKNSVYSRIDAVTGQILVAGKNASANLNLKNDFVNFSPRIGAAYSLDDRTVIRSGFAVFHSNFWVDNGELVAYPGWTASQAFPDAGVGRALPFPFSQGFPVEQVPLVSAPLALFAAATPERPLSVSSLTYAPNDKLPYNIQWNFGVQRVVGFNTVLEVSYIGSRSVGMSRVIAANNPRLDRAVDVVINRVPFQQVRPFPNLGGFSAVHYDGTGKYHSLQVKAGRRFRSGFSLDANYTFSKNIDTSTSPSQIPWQYADMDRAVSNYDRPQVFSLGWVYELPVGKGKPLLGGNRLASAVLGGFQVNGILSASSGLPMTIGQNRTNIILNSQRPDVIDPRNLSGRVAQPVFVGAARTWLIRPGEAGFPFTQSSNLGFGNLGRNTARAPGFWNLNLSLFRSFPLTEKVKLQLRFEAFNSLNHVNFGGPNTNIDSSGYGLITSAAPARVMQIGARLSF